jgi:hypothetical protein
MGYKSSDVIGCRVAMFQALFRPFICIRLCSFNLPLSFGYSVSLEPQRGVCENRKPTNRIAHGKLVCVGEPTKPPIIVEQNKLVCVKPSHKTT